MAELIEINNQEICNQLYDLLIKKGLRANSYFNRSNAFTKEECALLDTIILENSDNIDELVLFPNLRVLKIKSQNTDTVIEKDPFKVNNIDKNNFFVLSYLTSLEELTIVNDNNIESINLLPLTNLKKIKLCNNKNLVNIIGLDQLKNLEKILIYANKGNPVIDADIYLENTKDALKNYLDITMFYDLYSKSIYHKDHKRGSYFQDKYLSCVGSYGTNLEFVEKVGIYNYYVPLRASAVVKLYERAEEVNNRLSVRFKFSSKEKMKSLYHYARKIEYDYDALDIRDTDSLDTISKNENLSYRMSLPNTSYTALVKKKTVCEGYANMLHLLFYMNGIGSRVIYCAKEGDSINGLNHAALRVRYHDEDYYIDADPNWGSYEDEFFMQRKEEFKKTHVLAYSENMRGCSNNDVKKYIKQ